MAGKPIFESQEPLINPIDRNTNWKQSTYKPEYCALAYQVLSEKKPLNAVAVALRCSRETIKRWRADFPDFNESCKNGMEVGENKFVTEMSEYAYTPNKDVNNGLIKILASHVYGIKDAEMVVINNSNTNKTFDAEEEMKKMGLSIPESHGEDVE